MFTPREKSPELLEKFSLEEDPIHDAASSRTVSPVLYQRVIAVPVTAVISCLCVYLTAGCAGGVPLQRT